LNAGSGVSFEDRTVFGEGDQPCGVFQWLPVRIVRAALHVVDGMAIQLERDTQFDERFHLALPGDDAVSRRSDIAHMAGADCGERGAAWIPHVHHTPRREVALERTRCFLLDLRPRGFGNRCELAMQIVHAWGSPFSEPMPSEPCRIGGTT
jgi:hypothetical protein